MTRFTTKTDETGPREDNGNNGGIDQGRVDRRAVAVGVPTKVCRLLKPANLSKYPLPP